MLIVPLMTSGSVWVLMNKVPDNTPDAEEMSALRIGYEFSEGRLNGISVLFQVNNLTNEPYIAYAVSETRQQDFQEYGRQFLLGVNYRL